MSTIYSLPFRFPPPPLFFCLLQQKSVSVSSKVDGMALVWLQEKIVRSHVVNCQKMTVGGRFSNQQRHWIRRIKCGGSVTSDANYLFSAIPISSSPSMFSLLQQESVCKCIFLVDRMALVWLQERLALATLSRLSTDDCGRQTLADIRDGVAGWSTRSDYSFACGRHLTIVRPGGVVQSTVRSPESFQSLCYTPWCLGRTADEFL